MDSKQASLAKRFAHHPPGAPREGWFLFRQFTNRSERKIGEYPGREGAFGEKRGIDNSSAFQRKVERIFIDLRGVIPRYD
jgi:hypothetical protein